MTAWISRRKVLAGLAGVAGAASLGYAGLSAFGNADLIRSMLQRLIGEFRMSDSDLEAFTSDFTARVKAYSGYRSVVMRVAEAGGLTPLASHFGLAPVADRIERYERDLITSFMLSTDYLQVADPKEQAVSYLGYATACNNPFARFDFD